MTTATATATAIATTIPLIKNIENLTKLRQKLNITKPIIKWIGGKTQIIDKILDEYPTTMHNYHEIFLGGGSVLLALLSYRKANLIKVNGNVYAYDLNETLISLYKNIQSNHNKLYIELKKIIDEFNSIGEGDDDDEAEECGEGEGEEGEEGGEGADAEVSLLNRKPQNLDEAKALPENYYFWSRIKYNALSKTDKNGIIGSALFIFLNKTCFRGMFRVGPKGFNVPYGNYSQPEIINKEHLQEVHDLIQGVIFTHCDFSIPLQKCINSNDSNVINDFIYLDPPYAPENNKSFVGYNKDGFNIEQHKALFKLCNSLHLKKIKFIMSNADVELLKTHFPPDVYNTQSIEVKRTINSKKPGSKAKEVIIKDF